MAVDVAKHSLTRHLNLNHLSEEECEAVLKVIQRDFDLRQHEQDRLHKIEEEVTDEGKKVSLLAKQKTFNENCCMRCFSKFIFLFNPKQQCAVCNFYVCKNCSEYNATDKEHVCNVCVKQKDYEKATGDWFYNNVKKKFKRFGSAKVVRSLYKRKTESEESDYAMSDSAIYGRDPTTGQKNRPQLSGLFEMDLDSPDKPSALTLERQKRLENEKRVLTEDNIIATKVIRPEKNFNMPYTCSVASPAFKEASDEELQKFNVQLESIVQEINRVLENNVSTKTGDSNDNKGINTKEEYEKLVDNHKLHLSSELTNLTQRLHIAVDQSQDNSVVHTPSAKQKLVKQTVVKHCEDFMREKINLKDEDMTSEYGSESGTEAGSVKPYEDLLAEQICKKLIYRNESNRKKAQDDEQELLDGLTKLSNEATIEQLNEHLSPSDMDSTYQTADVTQNRFDTTSDSDSRDEATNVVKGKGHVKVITLEDIGGSPSVDDSDLDDLVQSNLDINDKNNRSQQSENEWRRKFEVNNNNEDDINSQSYVSVNQNGENVVEKDEWIKVESKKSPLVDNVQLDSTSKNTTSSTSSLLDSELFSRDIENSAFIGIDQKHSTPLKSSSEYPTTSLAKPGANADRKESALKVSQIQPNHDVDVDHHNVIIAPVEEFSDEQINRKIDGEEKECDVFEFVREHQVNLPSFVENEEEAPDAAVDLDDISHMSSDTEDLDYPMFEPVVTLDGNITFGDNWSLTTSRGNKDKSFISAYDNIGDKKVGKQGNSPTIMLVPKADDEVSVAKIGDVDADQLSDLSENEAKSDVELDDESADDDGSDNEMTRSERLYALYDRDEGEFDEEGHFVVGGRILDSSAAVNQSSSKRKKDSSEGHKRVELGVQTDDLENLRSVSEQGDSVSVSGSDFSSPRLKKSRKSTEQMVETEEVVIDPATIEMKVKQKVFDINERPVSPNIEDVDPKFIVKPEKMLEVYEGEPVQFSVQVEGTQPVDVFWYNDMADVVDLADDDRCDIINHGNGKFSCHMYNTHPSDQGQYMCIAINKMGQCSRVFKMKILENTSLKSGPEFIKPLQDIEAVEGNEVKLKCKLKGYPQPRVQWYKDGKLIKPSDLYRMDKLGNRDYILTIAVASLADDAEFSVVARNVEGEARSVAQLIIEPRETEEQEEDGAKTKSFASSNVSFGESMKDLYPETDDLLKLAQQVQSTRADVERHAEEMLTSADRLLRMEQDLDSMDDQLNQVANDSLLQCNQDPLEPPCWKDEKVRESASKLRITTATALKYLTSMDEPLFEKDDRPLNPEEEIDVNFSYEQYDILYRHRQISTENIRKGKVKRKDVPKLEEFLRKFERGEIQDVFKDKKEEKLEFIGEDGKLSVIDCGLKRVDSKRYNKDYVVVRDSPQAARKKHWTVRQISTEAFPSTDVVKSTPAGTREIPEKEIEDQEREIRNVANIEISIDEADWTMPDHNAFDSMHWTGNNDAMEVINNKQLENDQPVNASQIEEDIYLATSQVYALKDDIESVEERAHDITDDTSNQSLEQIERKVAQMSAVVNSTENQVQNIESHLAKISHEEISPRSSRTGSTSSVPPMLPTTPQPPASNESPFNKSCDQSNSLEFKNSNQQQPLYWNMQPKNVENHQVSEQVMVTNEPSAVGFGSNTYSPVSNQSSNQFLEANNNNLLLGNNSSQQEESQDLLNHNNKITLKDNHTYNSNSEKYFANDDNEANGNTTWSESDHRESEQDEELRNLPSVKNLLSKFNQSLVQEDQQGAGFRREFEANIEDDDDQRRGRLDHLTIT